jgi:hypothetical protein
MWRLQASLRSLVVRSRFYWFCLHLRSAFSYGLHSSIAFIWQKYTPHTEQFSSFGANLASVESSARTLQIPCRVFSMGAHQTIPSLLRFSTKCSTSTTQGNPLPFAGYQTAWICLAKARKPFCIGVWHLMKSKQCCSLDLRDVLSSGKDERIYI